MTQGQRAHWEAVYTEKSPDAVSWYQPAPSQSLKALDLCGAGPGDALIDMGGGADPLAATLARQGWGELAVLDISAAALERARAALGPLGEGIDWIVADASAWEPPRAYDVWHDRAVFHFLTDAAARAGYKAALASGLRPGGTLIMATFASDGPEKCSGLDVCRYDPGDLARELGPDFALRHSWHHLHETPFATRQKFTWCVFEKVAV